ERAVEAGLHAVGYLSYEAASGLDARLQTHEPTDLPLVHFCFFRTRHTADPGEGLPVVPSAPLAWEPMQTRREYDRAIEAIRTHLVAGDTYQVNYTFRLRAPLGEDPLRLYAGLARAQQAPFAAYLDGGDHAILSASPELFFRLENGLLEARPMKGTRERGRWFAEDLAMADGLTSSPKERAENVMITDMLRNDLGRISTSGSVVVPSLFQAERYPTLWQLTSTVQSELEAGVNLTQLFAALFPCASVTGAPKVRTMEIIRNLEARPRGIYTGSIGYVSPGLEACFNVAIRTAHLNRSDGWLEYGVGGGITWDSSADSEYGECLVKARVLSQPRSEFKLLETLLWEEGAYFLLDRHVERVVQSAEYWGYVCDRKGLVCQLEDLSKSFEEKKMRVRITLSEDGEVDAEGVRLEPLKEGVLRAHW
ncbi:MAG: aminodeoxychorismate synthase component I, partial [Candidatus Latescibacterota bacterium]